MTTRAEPASVDQALTRIRQACRLLEPMVAPLPQAGGRILREPVLASEDQPPFDRSSVDGYAVGRDDRSTSFHVVGHLRAGDWKPIQLQAGEAVGIATGAALPATGLQVLMREDVSVRGEQIEVTTRREDLNIRFRGEDARAGAMLVEPGARLSPGALALLASAGCVLPVVTRLPTVLHVVTGDEIVPPEQALGQGQIRDSNSTLVQAFLQQWTIDPEQMRVPEDAAQARAAVQARLEASPVDLLLISGGASVGEHDGTAALLEQCGYRLLVHRTTTRPGKPLIFGATGGGVAFGLPGNPLAHFVCLHLYVRAALQCLEGADPTPAFVEGLLDCELQMDAGDRETLWPGVMTLAGGMVSLHPLPWRSSGDLTCLAGANALLRLPPGGGSRKPGARVAFLSTAPWL